MFEHLLTLLLTGTLSLSGGPSETNFDDRSLLSVSPIPQQKEETQPESMSADGIIAVDVNSEIVLYERNAHDRLPIASITKLMTAALVMTENHPDDVVTVSANASSAIGSRMGLYTGEQITVLNLLHGLLIESGNDAAVALAEYNAGSVPAFIKKMNLFADELGLEDTHYVNPTGLDSTEAYSSAHDVATLAAYLAKDPNIRDIIKLKEVSVSSIDGHVHTLKSTNALLGELGVIGFKTGTTPMAKENLTTLANSPTGHEIITVVLHSDSRFTDTRKLLNWIYSNYEW